MGAGTNALVAGFARIRSFQRSELLRVQLRLLESFNEFPPRSAPQSFNPAKTLEETLRDIKAKSKAECAFPMLRPKTEKSDE